jgi:hypothetical protein
MDWWNNAGAVVTVAMGCLGLFLPARAAAVTGLAATSVEAKAEFRGTLGVTFLFLGAMPLLTQNALVFLTVGLTWLGAGLGRVVSIAVDGGNSGKNWSAVAFEGVIAALLIAGAPLQAIG